MTTSPLTFACQTYTWEMLGSGWTGGPDDLIEAISKGGYAGIEITDTMIGAYADRPDAFARALDGAGLALVAFMFSSDSGFTSKARIDDDLEGAKRWADFAARFPGALLAMGSATMMSEGPRTEAFSVAAEVYNRASQIARDAGVTMAIHPSSHHNTLLYTGEDYRQIFTLLDPRVGWVPDTGHILRGGQVMDEALAAGRDRIRYVHLKDVDAQGDWSMLGEGVCDIAAVIASVRQAPHFNGWIVVEEESETAAADPAAAVRRNRETIARLGFED